MGTELRINFTHPVRAFVESSRNATPQSTLHLALHGMGESGESLRNQLAPTIESSGATWIIPDAPLPFEKRSSSGIGRSWYLYSNDQKLLRTTMDNAIQWLIELTVRVRATYGLSPRKSVVMGFSQGGYLAGYLCASNPRFYGSACCIGGRLKHEFFPPVPAEGHRARFLQLHGEADASVSPELAIKAVEATRGLGYEAEVHLFKGSGHELSPAMLEEYLRWESSL